jgi:hypothetical protein
MRTLVGMPTRQYNRRRVAPISLLVSVVWATWLSAEEVPTSIVVTSGAVFGRRSAEFALVELRSDVRRRLSLGAALGYVSSEHGYSEWQGRAFATANVDIGRWLIDDRNMLYLNSEGVALYRNRIRATFPRFLDRSRLSAHVYDEIYYDLERERIARNNLAIGLARSIADCCRVELSHVWSDDHGVREGRFWLALFNFTRR